MHYGSFPTTRSVGAIVFDSDASRRELPGLVRGTRRLS